MWPFYGLTNKHNYMSERKRIYLCLAHMSEDGMEQKYVKEAFDTNWVVLLLGPGPGTKSLETGLQNWDHNRLQRRKKGIAWHPSGGAFLCFPKLEINADLFCNLKILLYLWPRLLLIMMHLDVNHPWRMWQSFRVQCAPRLMMGWP